MTERIFVSYAHEDRGLATSIEQKLREHGVITAESIDIVDPSETLQAGDNVRDVIRSRMNGSDMVVIIASGASARSAWVNYEAGMALALDKPVVILAKTKADAAPFRDTFENARLITLKR
jgi:hypothetical protein